jgi:LDH2 family malate/lactate/ureidoglycolate dehydrogenase
MFIAIDVATLGSPEDFQAKVTELIEDVKATPLAQDASEIFYPGEIEDRNDVLHRAQGGLVLPEQTLADLHKLAEQCGLDAVPVLGDRP